MKVCSKKGCEDVALHKVGESTYCDKHYAWRSKTNEARKHRKTVPSVEIFENLWDDLLKNNFTCPCCGKKMIVKSSWKGLKRDVVSLQHWNNGGFSLICHSCNISHGHANLGDGWKNIPDNHKYCPTCNETKSSDKFYNCDRSPDKLWWRCKACDKDYRKRNRDKINAQKRNNYLKNKNKLK